VASHLSVLAATFKFGYVDKAGTEFPYQHKNIWAREKTSGPDRLVIAPSSAQVDILLKLAAVTPEPYFLLYVLHTPRSDVAAGRYQSPEPVSRDRLMRFLHKFRDFLEGDARHDLWVGSPDKSFLLVYDRHQILFAYGPLDSFKSVLVENGLQEADEVRLPDPHVHRYNQEFDLQAADLLGLWSWKQFPLQDSDRQ
jgi:hypothetical protein